ncbi:hypothetical protein C8J56DRAFT_972084 [Mycena floridula]|nr:hypothetical protein C8J56DRAFT_972084 [Mycena floridula]
MRPPDSTDIVRKMDFKPPNPPSKHARGSSQSASGRKPASHIRSSASVGSLSQLKQSNAKASPSTPGKKRLTRPPSPETEFDDTASVAESFMSTNRVRRTEPERIEYFKNQPECDPQLEPHRVRCLRCRKHVSLGTKTTYAVKPWESHRLRCDQKVYNFEEDNQDNESDVGSIAPSVAQSEATVRRTEEERKAILEADPRALKVEAEQVFCKRCQKWIRLSSKTRFALTNWNRHQQSCSDAVPSSRVTFAERQIRILNDKQAKVFTETNVKCAFCDLDVALDGTGQFDLTNWELHKAQCPQPSNAPASGSDTTAVASSPKKNLKRKLEDDEEAPEDPDARATNRPRTENYQPPQQESPGPLGWFLMPFKAFVHGFKDSLKS